MDLEQPITVYGAGSWGTTLAIHLARKGRPVLLWGRSEAHREEMSSVRENRKYLPGIPFPGFIHVVPEGRPPAPSGPMAVLAVPSDGVRSFLADVQGRGEATWVITTKGIEVETGQRMSEVVGEVAGVGQEQIVTLAGPSLAQEVAEGKPAAILAASVSEDAAARVQEAFASDRFRVYRSQDPVGVELATSLKNPMAVAAGVVDGLGLGHNARGALLTRGLAEITRLGVALGGQRETFQGLAGVGDLITTCTSALSRNYKLGSMIGQGLSLDEAMSRMTMVAEGVKTTKAAVKLADGVEVEVPILEKVAEILFQGLDPSDALESLMTRPLRAE